MFKSKYLFETSTSKNLRVFKTILKFALSIFIIYTLACFILAIFSQHESENASTFFYKRPPDLITILTGDSGRIPFGLKIASEYGANKIFITGVYSKNTTETLLKKYDTQAIDINSIEIDHARNTVENIISVLRYLKEKNNFKNVLIITHDYHIMRTKLITEKIKDEKDKTQFFYLGLQSNYSNLRSIKILYKEVFKLIRAYIFLIFWEQGAS